MKMSPGRAAFGCGSVAAGAGKGGDALSLEGGLEGAGAGIGETGLCLEGVFVGIDSCPGLGDSLGFDITGWLCAGGSALVSRALSDGAG